MKKIILHISLSLLCYFASGQCGPYALTAIPDFCSSYTLTVSGASAAQLIVWDLNGTLDTVYPEPSSSVLTVAGGTLGSGANQFNTPLGVCLDASGNIYVADFSNNRIQKFPPGSTFLTNGTTVAGGNGQGSAANQLNGPSGIYVDGSGYLYVADQNNNRVQKFPPGSTSATNGFTVAGNGTGSAISPTAVFVDGSGYIYVADIFEYGIIKFPPWSNSSWWGNVVAAGNFQGSDPDQFMNPTGLYVDGSGNIYVADEGNFRVQEFSGGSLSGNTIAGGNGPGAANNQLNADGVYVDGSGNIYITDEWNGRVLEFPPGSSSATYGSTVAGGNGSGSSENQFNVPYGLYLDNAHNIYVADALNNRIQKWFQPIVLSIDTSLSISSGIYSVNVTDSSGCTASSSISISNGLGLSYFFPDSASQGASVIIHGQDLYAAVSVQFGGSQAASFMVLNDSTISAVVGNGTSGLVQVFTYCSNASLSGFTYTGGQCGPYTLTATDFSCTEELLTVSGAAAAVKIVWENNGIAFDSVFAGLGLDTGFTVAGGNGQGIGAAQFYTPTAVFIDAAGYLYVADDFNNRIQKFPPGSTSATQGTTVAGGNGWGGAANQLAGPTGVYVDGYGNIYVADFDNNRIQEFPPGSSSATNGTTVAGGNGIGIGPNQLYAPEGVYVDASGDIFVADAGNQRIQEFTTSSFGLGTTVAGGNGQGSAANQLTNPNSVYLDGSGNMYVVDMGNHRIQKFPPEVTPAQMVLQWLAEMAREALPINLVILGDYI